MRKLALLFLLALPAFCQTPCIDDARQGKVGLCINATVPVTRADAQFVAVSPIPGYVVDPDVPYTTALEFSTKEQATAIIELVKFFYPGSNLTLVDNGATSFSYPPFRTLKYFNQGGMFEPRYYVVQGTIQIDGSDFQTNFIPGWFLNVSRLIMAPGAMKVVSVVELGGAYPHWK